MWQTRFTYSSDKKKCVASINHGCESLSFKDVINLWRTSQAFRSYYIEVISALPFDAVFWESPPLTRANLDSDYEFAAVQSTQLVGVSANSRPFAEHLENAQSDSLVLAFENLGGDAVLIVPCQVTEPSAYPHLLRFMRNAPNSQRHEFLISIATHLSMRLNDMPLWLSTSGLGVYWLHARLDTHPKYYVHLPYTDPKFSKGV